jgi:anthranilate synthase component 2
MILMIDNYDSFTYNIVQYCKELGANLKVIRNDELTIDEIRALNPEKIILSPGPSEPKDAGVTLDVIKEFSGKIPLFGICLGHQAIGQAFGGDVVRAAKLMHGKTSKMNIVKDSILFADMPKSFQATRYHSLIVDKNSLPAAICPTAFSEDDNEIMALEIPNKRVYGVQFHPESILSEYGYTIIDNFLKRG